MINWTEISKDPNDGIASRLVSNFLTEITKLYNGNKTELISGLALGKEMLDIGAGQHSLNYFNEKWEHAIYKKHAAKIVAIEISNELCDFYNEKGFDFRCIDATSDITLDEQFDFVYCGDVIEHVENPVKLIKFAARHMKPGALCLITTPNPCYERFKNIAKSLNSLYFISNLEHVAWIVPTHMLEITRRSNSGLSFEAIVLPEYAYQDAVRLGSTIESFFEDYIYILKKPL